MASTPGPGSPWHDDITVQLEVFDRHVRGQLRALLDFHANRCQNAMRSNAPWRDQTGNARNGLFAQTAVDLAGTVAGSGAIVLFHSVAYGIYLETRWAGRYAVIMPTIETEGPLVMASVARILGGP
jgi:hypothetical protein